MRRVLRSLIVALLLLAGGWSGYWFHAARLYSGGILAWAEDQRAAGRDVHLGDFEVKGFPLSLRAEIETAVVAEAGAEFAWEWRAQDLAATALPWNIHRLALNSDAPASLRLSDPATGRHVLLAAARFDASGQVDSRGNPAAVDVTLFSLTQTGLDGMPFEAAALVLSYAARPDGPNLTLRATDIALPAGMPPALGDRARSLIVTAAFRTALPDGPDAAALTAWRDAGHRLALPYFELEWGPVRVTGDAQLSLDRRLQPAGTIRTTTRGYRAAVDAAEGAGLLAGNDAAALRLLLEAIATRPEDGAAPRVAVELKIEKRRISTGFVDLGRLPRIHWPGT